MKWVQRKIGSFCDTGSGGTPSRDRADEFYGGGIPWVKSGELRESIITETGETLTEAGLTKSSAKIVPAGAVLVAMYGATVGRVGILGIDAATNQAVCNIIPRDSAIYTRYLFHCLQWKLPAFLSRSVGGAQPNISQEIIRETLIPLPPLEEQRRIAAILDKADALRQKRRLALQKLDSLTQSIFLDMFGDPLTNPKALPRKKLGDLIEFVGGSQPPKAVFSDLDGPDKIRLVQIRDFKTHRYKIYIPRQHARRAFEEDDVMIGRYGPPVFQIFRGLSGSYNVALMKAAPKDGILKSFIYHLLRDRGIQRIVVDNSERTAGQSGVNLQLLESLEAYQPTLDSQREFEKVAANIENAITEARRHSEISERLFVSLQERAFAGHIDHTS